MLSELENRRILLRDLRLWVPMFQIGVPVYAYGFENGTKAIGPGYRFDVAPQCDSWLTPSGERLMPIDTSSIATLDDRGDVVRYPRGTRFSRVFSAAAVRDVIQLYVPTYRRAEEYQIKDFDLEAIWYEGPTMELE